ncbi:MAG: DUF4258 domain-containing protein [Ignavibacteriales bacterium]|nr:DUF4258 domain-containing protein [Ignavibacteriales bacterium]
MTSHERMVSAQEVKQVIFTGDIIEDYPEDKRGHSCLMFGHGENNRPIHVVCSPKKDYLAIITAYVPTTQHWKSDFKTRK